MCSPDRSCPLRTGAQFDVIIVGARAAGAAVALLLARHGLRVLLLDHRRTAPATLPLTRAGVLLVARWGVLDEVIAGGTPPVTRTTLRSGNHAVSMTLRPSHGVGALYAPRHLPRLLLAAAVDAGAELHDGVAVRGVVRHHERVVGVRAVTPGGRVVELGAPLVIGADGSRSVVARSVGAPFTRQGDHATVTTSAHRSGLDTDGYEWTFGHGVRSGVIPTDGGRSLVFVSAPAAADGHGRRAFIRCSQGPGWALVGDAGHSKDPLSAHGFTDPLRDAELLAGAVRAGMDEPASMPEALAEYELARDRLGIPIFDVVDRIAGHQWDDAELSDLLLRLSSAMADEVEALAGVDVSGR